MAKLFDRPVKSTTVAEQKECVTRIRSKLKGRRLRKFEALSEAQQLAFADKTLKKFAKRDKAGAIDWEGFLKFIMAIFQLLAPLFV